MKSYSSFLITSSCAVGLLAAFSCALEEDPAATPPPTSSSGDMMGSAGAGNAPPMDTGATPTTTEPEDTGPTGMGGMPPVTGMGGDTGVAEGGAGATPAEGGAGGEMVPAEGGAAGMAPGAGGATGGMGGMDTTPELPIDIVGVTPNEHGFTLKDSWLVTPCYDKTGTDCRVNDGVDCDVSGNTDTNMMHESYSKHETEGRVYLESFDIGGEAGKMYDVTIAVRGIVEAKTYLDGTRDAGNLPEGEVQRVNQNDMGTDAFYRGGRPRESTYNIYRMTVFDAEGNHVEHFYFNSFNPTAENGLTFAINYEKTIKLPGGGKVEYLNADRNCKAINNCGSGQHQATDCAGSRRLPGDASDLALPEMYGSKPLSAFSQTTMQPYQSQIVSVKITDVKEAQ